MFFSLPLQSPTSLILLALLTSLPSRADTGTIIRLNPGQTQTISAAALDLLPDITLLMPTVPAGIQADWSNQRLNLTCNTNFGWEILESNYGDFLLRSGGKVNRPLEINGRAKAAITVFGSFNSWNRDSHPLTEISSGHYQTQLSLQPGDYQYLFRVDGKEILDPANPDSVGNGFGGFNSLLRIRRVTGTPPVLRRLGWEQQGSMRVFRFAVEACPTKPSVYALSGNQRLAESAIHWTGKELQLFLPGNATEDLRVAIQNENGASELQRITIDSHFRWEDAIVYSLMPDRFRDGDPGNNRPVSHPELADRANWQGGDLQGILDALREGYFEELGINTLWIFPLVKAADGAWREYPEPHRMYTGYHGYWPVASRELEPRFGDEQLFHAVVDEAHKRGIKVLLDFVSNHVHQDHPWVREHPDWFSSLELPDGRKNLRIWDEYRLTTWFEPYMPDIDYSNPGAVDAACNNALWWLKTFQLDGFRHDAVKHVPRHFWSELTRRIHADPELDSRDLYQIGETFGSDDLILSYVGPDAMDAQFNFNLYHPARALFLDDSRPFSELGDLLKQNLKAYGRYHLMGNLMDSHDKARFAVFADGDLALNGTNVAEAGWLHNYHVDHADTYDKLELYMVYLMTIPGIPFIYYGDEIGMSGAGDPDNRRMMRFGADTSPSERILLKRVSQLTKLRRQRPELRRGDFEVIYGDAHTLVYLRSAETATGRPSRSLVCLNRSAMAHTISFSLPLDPGTMTIDLAPWEGRIIQR